MAKRSRGIAPTWTPSSAHTEHELNINTNNSGDFQLVLALSRFNFGACFYCRDFEKQCPLLQVEYPRQTTRTLDLNNGKLFKISMNFILIVVTLWFGRAVFLTRWFCIRDLFFKSKNLLYLFWVVFPMFFSLNFIFSVFQKVLNKLATFRWSYFHLHQAYTQ